MSNQTEQIRQLLLIKHPPPEWATFSEMRTSTGAAYSRAIDVFAFNTYPSKRHQRVAYEIKVSRGDFSRELDDPSKREPSEKLANECYFVTPVGLVAVDEIPEGWGLIELTNGAGLRTKKRAKWRDIEHPPIGFVASLLRRVGETPSPLPATVWYYAGKEIPQDKLIEAANRAVERKADERIRDALATAVQPEDVERYKKVYATVVREVGYSNVVFPGRLEKILAQKNRDLPKEGIHRIREAITHLEKIVNILEETNDD